MIRAILIYLNRLLDRLNYIRAHRSVTYAAWMQTAQRIVAFLDDPANDLEPRDAWPLRVLTPDGRPQYACVRRPFVTRNGHSISMQFSALHYCKLGEKMFDTQLELWNCPPLPALSRYRKDSGPYAFVPLGDVAMYVCILERLPAALPAKKEN